MKRLFLLAGLAGCTVTDNPYPIAWDPLAAPAAADCRQFEGTYADRGEAFGTTERPSLTRELFGADSPWAKAASVRLEISAEDAVEVTVAGADKRDAMTRIRNGEDLPAARIRSADRVLWLGDRAALG